MHKYYIHLITDANAIATGQADDDETSECVSVVG